MFRIFYSENLRAKAFLITICLIFTVSCQSDEKALKADAEARAEINRVSQLMQKGQKLSQKDVEAIKQIYADYPSSETARNTLKNAYIRREDWASLEKLFIEIPASELSEEDRITFVKVYIKLGRYNDAVETLQKLENKNNSEAKSLLANAYFHLGKYDEAKGLIDTSWQEILQNKRDEEIVLRGMIYFYQKENDKAIETLEKALEINPGSVAANNGLSRIYAARGENEKAEEYLAKVQESFDNLTKEEQKKSTLAAKLYSLQEAYKAKRFQEVINIGTEILPQVTAKNKPALLQYLYNSYLALGKQKEAQEILVQAKQLQQQR